MLMDSVWARVERTATRGNSLDGMHYNLHYSKVPVVRTVLFRRLTSGPEFFLIRRECSMNIPVRQGFARAETVIHCWNRLISGRGIHP